MQELTYKLELFEGPLELLLSLVNKNKMDINDIQISVICDQYMEYIDQAQKMDMDLAEIITLFVGKNVSPDQRVWLTEKLYEIYEDCEIVVYEGGQELYDYYLAVE